MGLALMIMPKIWQYHKSTSIIDAFPILYNKLKRNFTSNYLYEDKPQG